MSRAYPSDPLQAQALVWLSPAVDEEAGKASPTKAVVLPPYVS